MKEVQVLKAMTECLFDHPKCSEHVDTDAKTKRLFPLLHADKLSYANTGKIKNIQIVNKAPITAAGLERCTRRMERENESFMNDPTVTEKHVDEKLQMLVTTLFLGQETEVFDANALRVISLTKIILDVPSIAIRLNSDGYIKVAVEYGPEFLHAVRSLPVRSLVNVSDEEVKSQFREFLNF